MTKQQFSFYQAGTREDDGAKGMSAALEAIGATETVIAMAVDRCDAWWCDVLCARAANKRVFVAGSHFVELAMLRRAGVTILECDDPEQAQRVARALVTHDANAKLGWVSRADGLDALLARSESPIESRLACHLWSQIETNTICSIEAQVPLLGGAYRADFAITTSRYDSETPEIQALVGYAGPVRVVIEADGHDFHERTKEQAARDKRRDRDLQTAGWTVLRFSGSEIWRAPHECVEDVMRCLDAKGASLR
jgi:hypothetical protein